MKRNGKIIALALTSFILGVGVGLLGSSVVDINTQDSVSYERAQTEEQAFVVPVGVNELQNSFRDVAQKLLPSVVTIRVGERRDSESTTPNQSPWFDFFFGRPNENGNNDLPEFRARGFGSGVIVRRAQNTYYVLTNGHVIGDADEIEVILSDSSELDAELVGIDTRKDLALISFNTNRDIPLAELGNSDEVVVGDWVLAIGSPFNFQSTVTAGIVSALGRRGGPQGNINDFIQTDAAINQGNSGGALVNIKGQVIGINTWITSRTGVNIGLGFAIPVNNVKKPINDFIAKGRVEYGWLGISIRTLESDEAELFSLPDTNGALVLNVFDDSPADRAGILPGDFIFDIAGSSLSNSDELLLAIGDYPVGETAVMKLYRQGEVQTVRVRITTRDSEQSISDQNNELWPGIRVGEITDTVRDRFDLRRGVQGVVIESVEPRTPSAIAGLRVGDIITRVNDQPVDSLLGFYAALNSKQRGTIDFNFTRQDQVLSIGISR